MGFPVLPQAPRHPTAEFDIESGPLWRRLTNSDNAYHPSTSKVSLVYNPTLRYAQRMLGYAFLPRSDSLGVLSMREFFILQCMLTSSPLDLGAFLAHQFSRIANTPNEVIHGGGLVTILAMRLGLGDRLRDIEPIPEIPLIDMNTCRGFFLQTKVGTVYHACYLRQPIFPLPCQRRTTPFHEQSLIHPAHRDPAQDPNLLPDPAPPAPPPATSEAAVSMDEIFAQSSSAVPSDYESRLDRLESTVGTMREDLSHLRSDFSTHTPMLQQIFLWLQSQHGPAPPAPPPAVDLHSPPHPDHPPSPAPQE